MASRPACHSAWSGGRAAPTASRFEACYPCCVLLGLISDTHIPEAREALWPEVYDAFRDVDAILHAGDLHAIEVLDWLEQRCGVPVFAARGNGDDGGGGRPVTPEDRRLKPAYVLTFGGLRIGLVHDLALPEWPPYRTLESMMEHHFGGRVDVIVHGDTHVEEVSELKGVLLVNPGSPTFPRNYTVRKGTIGFLEVERGAARAWVEWLPGATPIPRR